MAGRISMAIHHAIEMTNKKRGAWDGPVITMTIENKYRIERHASLQVNDPIPFIRGQGEGVGLYKGPGIWLMTISPADTEGSSKGSRKGGWKPAPGIPLATSDVEKGIHETPQPFPFKGRPFDIKFQFSGNGVPETADVVLKQQVIELPTGRERSLVKHFLNGRISIRLIRVEWEGPFINIMSEEAKKKYADSFQSIDGDCSGSINKDELLQIFLRHNYSFTAEDVAKLVKRYSETVQDEVTFDEYCEMMEAEGCAGKAWFVAGIRAVLTEGGFEELMMSSDELLFGRLRPLFQEMFDSKVQQKNGVLNPEQVSRVFESACKRLGLNSSAVLEAMGGMDFDSALTSDEFVAILGAEPFRSTLTTMYRARFKILNAERSKDLIELRARAKLIQVKGTFVRVSTQLVACSHSSLNSGDVFLLDCDSCIFFWSGKDANEFEILRGRELATELSESRSPKCSLVEVQDGKESADFWFALGGKGPVAEAGAGMSDEIAEGLRPPTAAHPSPRRDKCRCAIIGSGVTGAVCAKEIIRNSGIEVVVFESSSSVGGRLGSVAISGVPFSAGAAYFCAAGSHLKRHIQELITCGIISQWNPRIGILTTYSTGTDESPGFVPALHTIESEVNVEAWLESRPKTGMRRHEKASIRPAAAFLDPTENISMYDLPPPDFFHRRSHAQNFGQGHGSQTWYICKPDMSQLAAFMLSHVETRLEKRVQAIIPKLGQGMYELVVEDVNTHQMTSAGSFDFVLCCTPPNEASRLLQDVQPSLASIPANVNMLPVWVVLVSFDHPVPTPYDVYFCEDLKTFEPVQSIFRESSRYTRQDPCKGDGESQSANMILDRIWEKAHRIGSMWGWGPKSEMQRCAPSVNVHGAPLDSWVIHLNPQWSFKHCLAFSREVAEIAITKFLSIVGLENAKFRVVMSEAVLWEHGALPEPASVNCMKSGADLAFGPYCIFDPATGIGMGGDWCVESSVEGAFVSGLELAARVCKSPIMYHQGVSNPIGQVQFALHQAMHHRAREVAGLEVITGYSSDSRPSTCFDTTGMDFLDWEDRARLQSLERSHSFTDDQNDATFVRKTAQCGNEGCHRWIPVHDAANHAIICPFKACQKCPYLECGMWVQDLESHQSTCKVTKVECEWCFLKIPSPNMMKHQKQCIAHPNRIMAYVEQPVDVRSRNMKGSPTPQSRGKQDGFGAQQIPRLPQNRTTQVSFEGLPEVTLSRTMPVPTTPTMVQNKEGRNVQSRESVQSRARTQEKRE